jgi:hypothetical protein
VAAKSSGTRHLSESAARAEFGASRTEKAVLFKMLAVDFLDRYLEGQCIQVWTELYGLRAEIRDPETWPDAQAVARETMGRIARNLARLRDGLPAIGYRFARPEQVLVPPPADVAEQIGRVESTVGPLPLGFRAFWETVGAVDLSGEHPDWPHDLLDPLMYEMSADYTVETYEDMVAEGAHRPGEPFDVDFAPDDLHKADISGGSPYAVLAPDPGADGVVLWEIHQTTFVNYVRIAMRHAGLAGLSPVRRHGHPVYAVPPEVRELADSLEPF